MPKNRKTRKQKLQASMRPLTVLTTAVQPSAQIAQSVKIPEKFSLQSTAFQHTNIGMTNPHTYLRAELTKTGILSGIIILCEIVLFFLFRNHIIVLSSLPY